MPRTALARSAPRLALALLVLLSACRRADGQQAGTAGSDPRRFAAEIQAFRDWDAKNAAPARPLVFAGSSSIRLWNTGERFPGLPVVNRGFGGAHLSDVNAYLNETVLRYAPRMVVLYAGDNDMNDGKSGDTVFADYQTFVNRVHAADSTTAIVWIPIKPSIARWALWPKMKELNERVRVYAAAHPHLYYVDIVTPMLGADGKPRPELFSADGLHMTPAGYDLWTSTLKKFFITLQ